MSNEIMTFENEEFGSVRSIMIDGQPWFVGKDVAEALGYANPTKAIRDRVDDDDRWGSNLDPHLFTDKYGRTQAPTLINESGLYSLILSSKLDTAKKFKRWVTSEVLPSIRKHGFYATEPTVDELLKNSEATQTIFRKYKEEQAALKRENIENGRKIRDMQEQLETKDKILASLDNEISALEDTVEEYSQKADYCDSILKDDKLMPITIIAKQYGWSPQRMNRFLKKLKIQHKVGGTWVLNKPYDNMGLGDIETYYINKHTVTHSLKWYEKGRQFIYEVMSKFGYSTIMSYEQARRECEAEGVQLKFDI